MNEGPAVAAVEAQYGDQVTFVGIGGQADVGANFAGFVSGTGTDGFTQLEDTSGDLYEQFGTTGRSVFLFVNQDGSSEFISWGVAQQSELSERVEQLIAA
ncbi:MAG: hypothetical protein ACRBK7_21000 [Acidimicrobiales bacterium]